MTWIPSLRLDEACWLNNRAWDVILEKLNLQFYCRVEKSMCKNHLGRRPNLMDNANIFELLSADMCSSLSICCKCCLKQGISIKGFIYFLHYSRTLCPCKLFRSRMWSKGWNQPFNACIDLFELCGNSFSGNHFILTKNEWIEEFLRWQ